MQIHEKTKHYKLKRKFLKIWGWGGGGGLERERGREIKGDNL